jgi:predicted metal-dependent hydrolase
MIENRRQLFWGDSRVASLFLWHYIEEIEHRSSAAIIFDGVVGNRWYQLQTLRRSFPHMIKVSRIISEGFARHVPASDMGVDPRANNGEVWRDEFLSRLPMMGRWIHHASQRPFRGISTKDVLKMFAGLLRSQLPTHHPSNLGVPEWFHTWMASHEAGEDMAHYFGVPGLTHPHRADGGLSDRAGK